MGYGLCAVLVIAVGFNVFMRIGAERKILHADLLDKLPVVYPGWKVAELKIAETERMQKAVDEQLNFDQALYREYSSGGKTLSVYAAYWRPYKFNPRLISIHTPDVCWVVNGWKMKDPDYAYSIAMGAGPAWPAQRRVFEAGGLDVNVVYWHIQDGRLSGFAEGPNSASQSFFRNLWKDLVNGTGEQFFIRISSPQPWSEWAGDPLFMDILNTFSPVLLAK